MTAPAVASAGVWRVIAAINMAWQLGGDSALLRRIAATCDVLILVECRDRNNKPINVKAILGPDWRVWQNRRSGSLSGTVIAIRRNVGLRPRRGMSWAQASRLMRLSPKGRKVQARYMRALRLRDNTGPLTLAGFHLALDSTNLRDDGIRVLKRWWDAPRRGRVYAVGDCNGRPQVLAEHLDADDWFGADVMLGLIEGEFDSPVDRARTERETDHHILYFRYFDAA